MKAYLVYKPVMDYEESIEPYFICKTLEEANKRKDRIIKFCKTLHNKLPICPNVNDESTDEQWTKWGEIENTIRLMIAEAKYPYGLDLRYESSHFEDGGFVDVMVLPYYP